MNDRLRRIVDRITAAYKDGGFTGLLTTIASYTRWRLGGRPIEVGSPSYAGWIDSFDGIRPRPAPDPGTLFSVVCPVHNTPPGLLQACVDSVVAQTHRHWELLLVDDASNKPDTVRLLDDLVAADERITVITRTENGGISVATNDGIAAASGAYLVFLDHDDLLAPTALEWLATCTPDADLIYTDEDKIDEDGERSAAFFKPAWSPRLLLGVNYINHITCVRTDLVRDAGGLRPEFDGVQDHDLLLRLAERPLTVAHLPSVLYHWRAWEQSVAGLASSKTYVEERGLRALQQAIDRRGWAATARLGNGAPFNYRVHWEPENPAPRVKIVIPTRDHLPLLRQVLQGVFERTDGVDTHVVVVDNGSSKPETLLYLEDLAARPDVTVRRIDDAFNYSVLCNEGVRSGPDTPFVLLLNNDVEVLHRRWLLQMTGWLRDPQVVGVGAKLLFPDRTIQHAGVILGFGGIAGHYAGYMPDQPQLGNLHDQTREVACLTAACLLVRTSDYEKVGGMNEDLALDFQDVDFCLRLRTRLGGQLVYDPTYPLIHLQSASRGKEGASNGYTVARMRFLWADELSGTDPFYSPHFSLWEHDFRLAPVPATPERRLERLRPRIEESGTPSL